MKNKFLRFAFVLCLILPCAFMLAGCAEQQLLVVEKTYNLLGMTVIKDNSPDFYSPFTEGEYTTTFCGGMHIDESKLVVGKQTSYLIYDDSADTGIKAVYEFKIDNNNNSCPTYNFSSYKIQLGESDVTNLTDEEIAELSQSVQTLYKEVKYFSGVCEYGNTSIQLTAQNKSLSCHVVATSKEDNSLIFMSVIYGF